MISELTPQLLNELNFLETSHFDLMPWLRAILLVSPQPSDALALSVMERGVAGRAARASRTTGHRSVPATDRSISGHCHDSGTRCQSEPLIA